LYSFRLFEEGDQKNNALVAHYLCLAADQGRLVAQYDYGRFLAKGLGVPMNEILADHYLKLATDHGNTGIGAKPL
jgi:TPR repeat protein